MKINENFHDGCEFYSYALRERVTGIYQFITQVIEIKKILAEIKKEAVNLRTQFLSEGEREERKIAMNSFDARMQETVYSTLGNLEAYRQYDWEKLTYKGESSDERDDQV